MYVSLQHLYALNPFDIIGTSQKQGICGKVLEILFIRFWALFPINRIVLWYYVKNQSYKQSQRPQSDVQGHPQSRIYTHKDTFPWPKVSAIRFYKSSPSPRSSRIKWQKPPLLPHFWFKLPRVECSIN